MLDSFTFHLTKPQNYSMPLSHLTDATTISNQVRTNIQSLEFDRLFTYFAWNLNCDEVNWDTVCDMILEEHRLLESYNQTISAGRYMDRPETPILDDLLMAAYEHYGASVTAAHLEWEIRLYCKRLTFPENSLDELLKNGQMEKLGVMLLRLKAIYTRFRDLDACSKAYVQLHSFQTIYFEKLSWADRHETVIDSVLTPEGNRVVQNTPRPDVHMKDEYAGKGNVVCVEILSNVEGKGGVRARVEDTQTPGVRDYSDTAWVFGLRRPFAY
ncbi:hypothetical protein BJ508DRAFT_349560 [Ascobolus immersus RN42]|uniref:Uncharacterized protein n=1 Tax=Ascobolus immersus RN42 TaxID=1160509 RepID=A0A3N4IMH4_ASCIM|nr:hypothetical protein BJ508DRAFT_349560 [Ascobolus immersus RN42]